MIIIAFGVIISGEGADASDVVYFDGALVFSIN